MDSQIEISMNAQQFKRGMISSLSQRTAMPVFVIWFDKNAGGWCFGMGNELKSHAGVRRDVGRILLKLITDLKLFEGVVKNQA